MSPSQNASMMQTMAPNQKTSVEVLKVSSPEASNVRTDRMAASARNTGRKDKGRISAVEDDSRAKGMSPAQTAHPAIPAASAYRIRLKTMLPDRRSRPYWATKASNKATGRRRCGARTRNSIGARVAAAGEGLQSGGVVREGVGAGTPASVAASGAWVDVSSTGRSARAVPGIGMGFPRSRLSSQSRTEGSAPPVLGGRLGPSAGFIVCAPGRSCKSPSRTESLDSSAASGVPSTPGSNGTVPRSISQ